MPPPLVGVADPASLAALDVPWKARALRCLDLARMVFHILLAHASSPLDPPVHRGGMVGVVARLGQRILDCRKGRRLGIGFECSPGTSLICLRPDARSGATATSALLGTAARPHGLAVALATALATFLNDIQN